MRSGQEFGWRATDVSAVLAAAHRIALAAGGGQVQFIVADGTYELYWHSYDPTDRRPGEPWPAYVTRSHQEVVALLAALPEPSELVREAIESVPRLAEHAESGIDLVNNLWYILYFEAES